MRTGMSERILTDSDVAAIVEAIGAHRCLFDDQERKTIHHFAQSLSNGGLQRWDEILAFGDTLVQAKRAGVIALVSTLVGALLLAMWAGLQARLKA